MLKEFKEFAMTGNVVDMAIGVIIGAAFGAIVNSLVTDIIMPIIGVLTGGLDFTERYVLLKPGTTAGPYATLAAAKEAGAVTMNVGSFIGLVINFLFVAFALFIVVKAMNTARKKPVAPSEPPAPAPQERLLMEIRDLLKAAR